MPDIRHSIRIAAPADRLRALVAQADGFRQWWAEDVEQEGEAVARLGFFGRSTVYRLRRTQEDASRVVWRCESGEEWEGTELVFAARPDGAELALDFDHAGWRAATPYFVSCNTTWGALMYRLKAAAEGRRPGPLFRTGSLDY